MKAFIVLFKRGGTVLRFLECMAPTSFDAYDQHVDLLQPGEKLEIMPLELWREQQRENRAMALDTQAQKLDPLLSAMWGGA